MRALRKSKTRTKASWLMLPPGAGPGDSLTEQRGACRVRSFAGAALLALRSKRAKILVDDAKRTCGLATCATSST